MTKREGTRAAMEAVGRDASRDIDAGMTAEQRALLAGRLDRLVDVATTLDLEHAARAVAAESSVDVAAMLAHAAGGSGPAAKQLTVGPVAWGFIQARYAEHAGGGRYSALGLPPVSALFGVPVVLDPGVDPWSWQLLDRDGAEMAAGRITDQTL